MSRASKWKLEKAKVKVVFRLQFHATHVPQAGWDKLFITFIPSDSGKATAKTTKANVRNGTCKWADPIYETTRLLHDSRSKLYDEKLYKFVVAMGSSRSSILGEASINLADYTDALKPSIVALPLQGCNSGTILHVTVQLLTSKTGFREFEQQRELRERGLQTGVDINSRDGTERVSSSDDMVNDHTEKVNARVRLRPEPKELPSLEGESGLNEEYAGSPMGFDGSSNTSESLYAEKHDNSSIHEVDSLNYSVDNDLAISHEENYRLRGSLELAESTILELKLEVASLRNHADDLGMETQKFAQQISAEITSSEELAEEISVMKFECSKLKSDLQQLISLKSTPQLDNLFQGVQLRWKKGLLVVEDKIREIQRKVYLSLDDREARLIHLDFEALLNVLLELKQENLPSEIANSTHKNEQYLPGNGLDVDLFHPPDMLHCLSIPSVLPQEHDSLIATKAMEDKIFELLRELDGSKVEREGMIRKMNEMECYYEALVLELEENQKQMLVELQNLRSENSTCLYTVATTNAEIESIRQETNEQILRFSQERHESGLICKELERRAITSEAALKRARLNYSIAVDQLQKDLDLLSFQVLSMFETNETLIRKTCSEVHSQNMGIKKQVMGGDVLLDDMKKSLLFQEALYHKVEEELSEMHVSNVYLDIFSNVLRESLLQASSDIILLEKKIDELVQELDLSTESKQMLTLQLQSAMSDMAHQNQILGLKSEGLANENFLFTEKIAQLEALLRDCSSYKNEYEVCFAEKAELANLLTIETVTKENLHEEMSSLYEELELVKGEKDDLAHCNKNLQKLVNSLEEKLGNLLESFSEKPIGKFSSENTVSRDLESVDLISIVSQVEKIQFNVHEKNRHLLEEKKNLEDERDGAQVLLSTAKSEIVVVKQKLELELQNVGAKLEASNSLVEKLQMELETLANKLHISLDVEEKYETQNAELFDKLAELEGELQHLTSKNLDLDKEILGMETVTNELGRSKSTIDELTRELQELTLSLENKDANNAKLALELDCLNENFKSLYKELDLERSSKGNLQGLIDDLAEQLNDKNKQLLQFSQLEAELLHVRKQASDIEMQKKCLEDERDLAHALSSSASSEVRDAKKKFKHDIENMSTRLETLNALMEKFQFELENLADKLYLSLEAEENYANQDKELLYKFSLLESGLLDLTSKNKELAVEISGLNIVSKDLGICKLTIAELTREREELMISSQDKASINFRLESEFESLKKKMKCLQDELDTERRCKDNLRGKIDHLDVQLNEKNEEVLRFTQQEAELVHFRQRTSDLEVEQKNLEDERDQAQAALSSTSSEILVAKKKFKLAIQDMSAKLQASDALVDKLELELDILANKLQTNSEAEESYEKQNKDLLANLSLLEGDLQDLASKNTELAYKIFCLNTVTEELESCKLTLLELAQERQDLMVSLQDKDVKIVKLESELEGLKENSRSLHDELYMERGFRENLHGNIEHVTFQLNEKNNQLLLFSQQEDELAHYRQVASDLECEISELQEYYISSDIKLIFVRSQYEMEIGDLALKPDTSDKQPKEQEVKVSENLHVLSEQEIDCLISSDQEKDFFIVFLKAKFSDLKDQFSRLGENNDELAKLQRKCDELNNSLSEQVLRTEEFKNLCTHLKELKDKAEAETRKPDRPSSAERESLRIVFIKEQYESRVQELKHQVSVSEKHAEDMLLKLQDSVDELENMKRSEAANLKRNEELSMKVLELEAEMQSIVSEKREKVKAYDLIKAELECALLSLECCKEEKQKQDASLQEYSDRRHSNGFKERGTISETASAATSPKFINEGSRMEDEVQNPTVPANVHSSRGVLVPEDRFGIPQHEDVSVEQGPEKFAVINHHAKIQSLKSSMDHLHLELERMKNENSLLPHEDQHPDASVLELQTELSQLNEANEELRIRFPLYDELPGNGNTLERVFALEVELAEALQANKKSNVSFQSSFLKQHGDEQAIFQSFRDINELIKEMLNLKGKHTSMERELRDMHDRYSQLSLQLAEVEGERQKLMMTLKNSRSPKKFTLLNRSSSATLE